MLQCFSCRKKRMEIRDHCKNEASLKSLTSKKNTFTRLMALLLLTMMPAIFSYAQSGKKLYVYSSDGAEQSFALENLKLTFTEQGINILPATGNPMAMLYSDVLMTFEAQTIAIPAIKNSDLNLYWEADHLKIESDTEIKAVKLFNLQGKLLTQQSIQSPSTTLPLSSSPAGVYIVQITTEQGVSIHKIIKQ